jgi:H+/Cl- antiporter ClcA
MSSRSFKQALSLRWHRIWLPRLRRRALFMLGGVLVGLAAVAMAYLADWAQSWFFVVERQWPYLPLLVTPLGFALLAWLTKRYFDGAQGSGIPQVIAARQLSDPGAKQRLVSLRLAIAKMFLLTAGLAMGASAGREGPTVQVGASIMYFLGRFAPHRQPGLLLAGGAAGVAAAFNAPLAGIVFGIEEMSRAFELRTSGLVLGTVIVAGLTSLAILGDYTYFGRSSVTLAIGAHWIAVPVVGLVCGLAGGAFSRVVIAFAVGLPGRAGALVRQHPVPFALACGLVVAICGVATGGAAFGTSAEQAKAILAGDEVTGLFGPLKLIATMVTSISGIPGGIFSPSLSVGAGLASLMQGFLQIPIGALAIMCMAAYLAAVLQAPITAVVIVTEMTGNHGMIFPVMVCAVIASAVSRSICKEGIYHALAHQLLRKAHSERNIT